MSLNKLARKVFAEAMKDHDGEVVSAEELFVHAFIIGFMYNEELADQDVEFVLYEEQLDLPMH